MSAKMSSMPSNQMEAGSDNGAVFKPNTSAKSKNKAKGTNSLVNVTICFLDESKTVLQVSQKVPGKVLFYQVCESLNLIELDYFGLEYHDSKGTQYWLDLEKPVCNQLAICLNNLQMYFAVKFYTTEPTKLEDELTRYLFALQVKKDLADGSLICSEMMAASLAAYIIQADCGDCNSEEYRNVNYVAKFKLIPQQDEDFEIKVMENHKRLIGLCPAEADLRLLDEARHLEMYGVKLSAVKDHDGVPLNLACIHNGILIFQNHTKVNTFEWSKVRKLSFKRKHFFIKLHQEEFFGDVLEFIFDHRNYCKNFWKKCIEQHSFFKCIEIKQKTRQKIRLFARGSSFRYAGRTQQQISDFIKSNDRAQKPFQRSNSMKFNTLRSEDMAGYQSDNTSMDSSYIRRTIQDQQSLNKSYNSLDQNSVSLTNGASTTEISSIVEDLNSMVLSHGIDLNSTLEFRRSNRHMNQDYYVFRDLVMTVRTYLKDFQLMQRWFKDEVSRGEPSRSAEMLSLLLSVSEPLIESHRKFLINIEYLLYAWDKEGFDSLPPLSKVLNQILKWLNNYEQLIERLPFILERINSNFCHDLEFKRVCNEFELKKYSNYMPYSSFIVKPAFHISLYAQIIQKLINCYCANHCDYINLKRLVEQLNNFTSEYSSTLESLINLVILIELQRDITGLENTVQPGRRFVREGCLRKLSKKGFQQRIFFLFSDCLIYASRSTSMAANFKIHGFFSLYNIYVEETDTKSGLDNCFTIYSGDKIMILSANSDRDCQTWIHDIKEAAIALSQHSSLQPGVSSSQLVDKINIVLGEQILHESGEGGENEPLYHSNESPTNTIVHVCWQRNCMISAMDYRYSLTTSFSGYLLRKFKNSSGWQKLWVEFVHFCLFFYKSSDDDFPLASLPVIGYTVSVPSDADNMSKSYVFKLQFKAHIYFFRAESEYAFNKWMEMIKQSTSDTGILSP